MKSRLYDGCALREQELREHIRFALMLVNMTLFCVLLMLIDNI